MNQHNSTLQFKLNLDYRWITIGLLAVIAVMLLIWKPWAAATSERTVDVTGEATISARPDKFVFYPVYEFKNSDKDAALAELTAKSKTVVAGLKKLGVADKDIKINSDSWSYPTRAIDEDTTVLTYSLRPTVTVASEALAQKVQDYLLTTSPSGTISPQPTFSDQKQRQMETEARDKASKDARKKAEQSAKNLGFRLGTVKAVNDGTGFGGFPGKGVDASSDRSSGSLTIQPGQNDITYSVTVTYYIK